MGIENKHIVVRIDTYSEDGKLEGCSKNEYLVKEDGTLKLEIRPFKRKRRLFVNLSAIKNNKYLIEKNGYYDFDENIDFCISVGNFPNGRMFDEVIYLKYETSDEDMKLTEDRLKFLNEVYFQIITRTVEC